MFGILWTLNTTYINFLFENLHTARKCAKHRIFLQISKLLCVWVFRSEEMKSKLSNLPQWRWEVLNAWTTGDSESSFYDSYPLLAVDALTLIMMEIKEVNTMLLIMIIHWLYIVSEPCVHTANYWPCQHAL